MEQQTAPWWRDDRKRTRAVVVTFLALALLGILYPAFTNYLFAGDQRVLVVTMDQDADQGDRDRLKQACGGLPGISVIADRGNPDPRVQGRFTVRFDIADTSQRQETELASCINRQDGVRGFLTENDGR